MTYMGFFDEDSHISDEDVALYVDALKLKSKAPLPKAIRDHIAECLHCKLEIEECKCCLRM